MRDRLLAGLFILVLAGTMQIGVAHALPVTVLATASVYGGSNDSSSTGQNIISLSAGIASFQFSVTGSISCTYSDGCVTLDGGGHYNNPDGAGSAQASNDYAYNNLSAISAPTAGYLAGVFVSSNPPTGAVPTGYDFTSSGIGTNFSSLSPVVNQVFFIGDGLTGDNTGSAQTFYVPTGATELWLGTADACGYGNTTPSCYGDNSGSFAVTLTEGLAVPEPASALLLLTGCLSLGMARRRFRVGRL